MLARRDLLGEGEDFVGGDAVHHGAAGDGVFVIHGVAGACVLDDAIGVAVGADKIDACGAVEGDEGAVETDGDVQGCGVVSDDERGALDDGHEAADGGVADEVDDAAVAFGEREDGGDLVALGFRADDDDSIDIAVREELFAELGEAIRGPELAGPPAGGRDDGVLH